MNFNGNEIIIPLIIGYLADLIWGDPRNIPHPVIAFGNSIAFCEKKLNKNSFRILKGAIVAIILPLMVFSVFYLLSTLFKQTHYLLYYIFSSIFVFYGLANKSLIQEGMEVINKLEKEGLDSGRIRLSWIVGRETKKLSSKQIYTAVLETMSENLSDGVVAPLFYYAIGGVPAMMCYKMINTLDSMIGYKNSQYKNFGMFAARIDDIANYIPARITSLLMILVSLSKRGILFIIKFANKHSSPNAGYPEAALAGILNLKFGGPNYYHNVLVEKPFIGFSEREPTYIDFIKTRNINHMVCLVSILIITTIFTLS
jgi:adenosylcobinamide-phosphate synthase